MFPTQTSGFRVVGSDVDTSSDRSSSPARTESSSTATLHSSNPSPKQGSLCRDTAPHDRSLAARWPRKYGGQRDCDRCGECPSSELVDCPSCGHEQLVLRRDQFSEKLKVLAKLLNYDSAWVAERMQKMKEAWSYLEGGGTIGAPSGLAEMKKDHSSNEEDTEDMLLTPATSLSSIIEGEAWEMNESDVEASRSKSKSPPSTAKTRLASKLPLRRPTSNTTLRFNLTEDFVGLDPHECSECTYRLCY